MIQGQKITNQAPDEILDLNTPFERSLSKLSENPKNVDIGSTVLKLWLLKGYDVHATTHSTINGSGTLSAGIT